MSDQAEAPKGRVIPAGGGTQVVEVPLETAYVLSERDFCCLREGERAKKEERWRDICLAVFLTSVPGFLSVLPDLDSTTIHRGKLVIAFIYAVTAAVSGILAIIFHRASRSTINASVYSRVVNEIETFFRTGK